MGEQEEAFECWGKYATADLIILDNGQTWQLPRALSWNSKEKNLSKTNVILRHSKNVERFDKKAVRNCVTISISLPINTCLN